MKNILLIFLSAVFIGSACENAKQEAKNSYQSNAENVVISAISNTNGNSKVKTYISEGTIIKINREKGLIEINHKGTGDFMPPKQSEFRLKETGMLEGLKVGDEISFALEVNGSEERIVHINK